MVNDKRISIIYSGDFMGCDVSRKVSEIFTSLNLTPSLSVDTYLCGSRIGSVVFYFGEKDKLPCAKDLMEKLSGIKLEKLTITA